MDPPSPSAGPALLTGATSGIGRVAAWGLAEMGFDLILTGRREEAGRDLAREIAEDHGGDVGFRRADLGRQREVRELAEGVLEDHDALALLVNNAGTIAHPRTPTEDGVDHIHAVNLLAPVLLTATLLPALRQAGGRVVTTSSEAHRGARLDPGELTDPRAHGVWGTYSRSKVGVCAWTLELHERLGGEAVEAVSLHPGFIPGTDLFRSLSSPVRWLVRAGGWVPGVRRRTVEEGGGYVVNACRVDPVPETTYLDGTRPRAPSALARDPAFRRSLWEEVHRLVGEDPELPAP